MKVVPRRITYSILIQIDVNYS